MYGSLVAGLFECLLDDRMILQIMIRLSRREKGKAMHQAPLTGVVSRYLDSFLWQDWLKLPASLSGDGTALINLLLLLLISGVSGAIVFACFCYYSRGVPVDRPMDSSLIPASILAALIFYQTASWPAFSILMVAFLGFIHYRTLVKDLTDVLFVFWSILSGVFIGIGFAIPALGANVILGLVLIFIIHRRSARLYYLLLLRFEPKVAASLMETVRMMHGRIRTQYEKNGLIDMTVEVGLRYVSMETVDRIAAMDGVHRAVMVSNDFDIPC